MSGATVRDLCGTELARATVGAWAAVAVPLAGVAALRAKPGPTAVRPATLKVLKNADEQTIAGMSALVHAIHSAGWEGESFRNWGVVAAPCFLGRMNVAMTTSKYLADPSWSVSPHVIPNQSLHSVSGTASIILALNGPNFGVGGGPNAMPEGFLTALSMMRENSLPGLWLILTQFDPEPTPDENGTATNAVTCMGAAIALIGSGTARGSLSLTTEQQPAPASLAGLVDYLNGRRTKEGPWGCSVPGLGTIRLTLG